MKKFIVTSCLLVLILAPWGNLAHAQRMEISSSSPEAIELMRSAFEILGHDMERFGQHIDAAYELDPNMPMANFFLATNPDRGDVSVHAEALQNYEGELTAGEKVFMEMLPHIEEEDYNPIPIAKQLTTLYPGDASVHLMLGFMHLQNDDPEGAQPYFKKATEIGQLPGAYNMTGYAMMAQGKMDEAKKAFEGYIEVAPEHHNPYDSMGDYCMAIEDYESAVTYFEKAAEINPEGAYHTEKANRAREMMNK